MNSNLERSRERIEVYNTIVLAITTLAVAWSSYQASLWNGIQTFDLAASNKYSRLAQQKIIQAGQSMAMEEAVIIGFVNAVYDRNMARADFIMKGVKPELSKIMSDWLQTRPFENPTAPLHPMATAGYQELMQKRTGESEKLGELGQQSYDEGRKANLNGDTYSLLTVLFSMVMFLGAIATKLSRIQLRLIVTVIASVICIGVLLVLFFYMPVAHKG